MSYIAINSTTLISDANLKAYWPLDGNSNDGKGSNNGSDTSMAYSSTHAKISSAADFTPNTSIIQVADAAAIQNLFDGGGTAGGWVYCTASAATSDRIFDKTGTSGTAGWWMDFDDVAAGNGSIHFTQNFANGTTREQKTSVNIPTSTLVHVVVTYDSSAFGNTPTIYINGTSVSLTNVQTPTGAYGSDASVVLGLGQRTGTPNVGFHGSLDELFLMDRALSAQEVSDLYNGNYGTPGGYIFFSS